jgi:hypothetical protein
VRRLVKVAKECKQGHTRASTKPKSLSSPPKPATTTSEKQDHLLGKKFAEATSKKEEDSDLDLDFLPDEASVEAATSDPANAHLTAGHHVGGALSPTWPASLPLSSFNILQRTDTTPESSQRTISGFCQDHRTTGPLETCTQLTIRCTYVNQCLCWSISARPVVESFP